MANKAGSVEVSQRHKSPISEPATAILTGG
jgi:hypothetical protein